MENAGTSFRVYDLYNMRVAYNIQLDFKRIIYDILTLCKLQTNPLYYTGTHKFIICVHENGVGIYEFSNEPLFDQYLILNVICI